MPTNIVQQNEFHTLGCNTLQHENPTSEQQYPQRPQLSTVSLFNEVVSPADVDTF